jgi:hypothetical protein
MLVLAAALGSPRDGTFMFLVRCAAFVVGLGLGLMSGSRGEVLAAIGIGLLFLPLARKIADVRQFVITAVAAVVILVGIMVVQSFFIGLDNRDRWSLESVTTGGGGRIENVADLASNYFRHPGLWPIGLGSTSFHDLPTSSGDPYSHVLVMDLILELGIPGITLGAIMLVTGFSAGRTLLARTAGDPMLRSGMAFLVGLTTFEFVVANKAGTMWGNIDLPSCCCILARLLVIPGSDDPGEGDEDSHDGADEEMADGERPEPSSDSELVVAGAR